MNIANLGQREKYDVPKYMQLQITISTDVCL
jgi:hypothetical protein